MKPAWLEKFRRWLDDTEASFASPTGFCGQVGTPPREAAMSKLWHQFS